MNIKIIIKISFNVKKHFLSTAHNVYGNFGKYVQVSNPGI